MANNWASLGYDNGQPICYKPDTVLEQATGCGTINDAHAQASVPFREGSGIVNTEVWQRLMDGQINLDSANPNTSGYEGTMLPLEPGHLNDPTVLRD